MSCICSPLLLSIPSFSVGTISNPSVSLCAFPCVRLSYSYSSTSTTRFLKLSTYRPIITREDRPSMTRPHLPLLPRTSCHRGACSSYPPHSCGWTHSHNPHRSIFAMKGFAGRSESRPIMGHDATGHSAPMNSGPTAQHDPSHAYRIPCATPPLFVKSTMISFRPVPAVASTSTHLAGSTTPPSISWPYPSSTQRFKSKLERWRQKCSGSTRTSTLLGRPKSS
mmetsp:Transcript_26472/g.54200  ORF Transcript_26472/g.54200 Transcript_26472/m.54200 type:complete len:223 (-) Transcript_26472:163-831(-)